MTFNKDEAILTINIPILKGYNAIKLIQKISDKGFNS